MRIYKTYEIWKMIDEDFENVKGKKFKLIDKVNSELNISYGDEVVVSEITSKIKGLFDPTVLIKSLNGFEEWEEVEEPVDFMELMEEIKENPWVQVSAKLRHSEHKNTYLNDLMVYMGNNYPPDKIADFIIDGKWYIQD